MTRISGRAWLIENEDREMIDWVSTYIGVLLVSINLEMNSVNSSLKHYARASEN
jgi:hypothetical protein